MKSRLFITMLLASGILVSSTGAALAIDSLSSSGNSTAAQYGHVKGVNSGGGNDDSIGVLPSTVTAGKAGGNGSVGGTRAAGKDPVQPREVAQSARQEQGADNEELPFTGLASIPLLLAGVSMLLAGLVLRRRAGRHPVA